MPDQIDDDDDMMALEHEPPQVAELLQRYVDGEIELEEAERRIDYDLYIGEEGAIHRKEDELVVEQRGQEALELHKAIEVDIERIRLRAKAKHHKPTNADHVERVAATLHRR